MNHINQIQRCVTNCDVFFQVVFQLQVPSHVHDDTPPGELVGVSFVRNVGQRDAHAVLSVGHDDVAYWNLTGGPATPPPGDRGGREDGGGALEFVIDVRCPIDCFRVVEESKMAVCASSSSGTLVVVNLARGNIQFKVNLNIPYHFVLSQVPIRVICVPIGISLGTVIRKLD